MQLCNYQKLKTLRSRSLLEWPETMQQRRQAEASTPLSGWGRVKDEDERKWALRCAQMAMEMNRPQRRGWRR